MLANFDSGGAAVCVLARRRRVADLRRLRRSASARRHGGHDRRPGDDPRRGPRPARARPASRRRARDRRVRHRRARRDGNREHDLRLRDHGGAARRRAGGGLRPGDRARRSRRRAQGRRRAPGARRQGAPRCRGVLAAVGGFEIAFLAGVVLGAADHRLVVLLDGFITGAAALVAVGSTRARETFWSRRTARRSRAMRSCSTRSDWSRCSISDCGSARAAAPHSRCPSWTPRWRSWTRWRRSSRRG